VRRISVPPFGSSHNQYPEKGKKKEKQQQPKQQSSTSAASAKWEGKVRKYIDPKTGQSMQPHTPQAATPHQSEKQLTLRKR
jgi:hypothetical protein